MQTTAAMAPQHLLPLETGGALEATPRLKRPAGGSGHQDGALASCGPCRAPRCVGLAPRCAPSSQAEGVAIGLSGSWVDMLSYANVPIALAIGGFVFQRRYGKLEVGPPLRARARASLASGRKPTAESRQPHPHGARPKPPWYPGSLALT